MTTTKLLYLAALVLFLGAALLCFLSTDVSGLHIVGIAVIGLACMAAAPLVS